MKTSTQIYRQTVEKFGNFSLIKISNGVNEIALVPEYGGHLIELNMIVNGELTNVLDSYNTPEALVEQDYYKNSFLLPYPNRLKDGIYSFNGNTYRFPINDKGTQNSLHGFKDFYKMSVENVVTEENYASITLKSDYQGQNPAFPFPFEFKITYTLKGYNELICSVDLYNPTTEAMPIGFGWHPYFKLGNLPVEELELQMPTVYQVEIDDRMLPTGELIPVGDYQMFTNLTGKNFDTCFKAIDGNLSKITVNAPSINTKLSYWQENKAFPYFQIFIPPKRKSIAIEPMTCNVNAFNRPDDLKKLNGKERLTGRFGVLVTGY